MQNPAIVGANPPLLEDVSAQLQLHELGTIDDAPATLTFDRVRPITLPWREMIEATNTSLEDSAGHASQEIRAMIERAWGVADDRPLVEAEIKELFTAGKLTGPTHEPREGPADDGAFTPEQIERNTFRSFETFGPYFATGQDKALEAGVFARTPSGRCYRLIFRVEEDAPLTAESFQTVDGYDQSWKRVISAEVVSERTPTDSSTHDPTTVMEYIDLRAPFIERRYEQLFARRGLAIGIRDSAETLFNNAVAAGINDPKRLDELKLNLLNAAADLDDIQRETRQLVRQAGELGYTLVPHPLPIGTDDDGKAGSGVAQVKFLPRGVGHTLVLERSSPDDVTIHQAYQGIYSLRSKATPIEDLIDSLSAGLAGTGTSEHEGVWLDKPTDPDNPTDLDKSPDDDLTITSAGALFFNHVDPATWQANRQQLHELDLVSPQDREEGGHDTKVVTPYFTVPG